MTTKTKKPVSDTTWRQFLDLVSLCESAGASNWKANETVATYLWTSQAINVRLDPRYLVRK